MGVLKIINKCAINEILKTIIPCEIKCIRSEYPI